MSANHFFVVAFVFLLLFLNLSKSSAVVTVNQSNFPWLQAGAYADYSSNYLGDHPWFVMPNGNLLIPITQGTLSLAELNWSVTERSGNLVYITVNYGIFGNENPQNWFNLKEANENYTIYFNYTISINIDVDVGSNMAYINNTPVGIINFWSSPLPAAGEEIAVGSIMLAGIPINVTGGASAVSQTNLPVAPIVSGVAFEGSLKQYQLMNSMFVAPSSGKVGWESYSDQFFVNGSTDSEKAYTYLDPEGDFNYYNGLALSINVPDYPINRTVCELNNSYPSNCSDRSFGTTLGQYFRSVSGSLFLVRTNISLEPTGASSTSITPQWPVLLVAAAVLIFGITGGVYYLSRRVNRSHPNHYEHSNR